MPKEKILWSFDGLSSVRSSKLREFRIEEINPFGGRRFRLIGVFSKAEFFEFGVFDTKEEAKDSLIEIHQIIEGGSK